MSIFLLNLLYLYEGVKGYEGGSVMLSICFSLVFQVWELSQFHRPWLMINDIFLQILKLWYFVEMFWNCEFKKRYFDKFQNIIWSMSDIFSFKFITSGPTYILPWDSWNLVTCKNGKWSCGTNTKNTRHKTGTHFKTQMWIIF